MMTPTPHATGEHNDGFIVVAVLWILGALATLAAIYSLYVTETAAAFLDHNERLQAQALAVSGVELAAYRLTAVPKQRPSQGQFSFREGSAVVNVTFGSENGRIDLNYAPKQVLAGLFIGLGADPDSASFFADRVIGWRTALAPGAADNEASIYQSAGAASGPRHGPFQSIDEIGLVPGMPPNFIHRARPYLTVYSGRGEVNLLSAPSAVVAALPSITPERLQMLMSEVGGNVPQDVMRVQLGVAASFVTLQPSMTDRVTVDMRFPSGRRIRTQAVILVLDNDSEPYRVLNWRNEELASDETDAQ
jgi:general secretion pathway protein K